MSRHFHGQSHMRAGFDIDEATIPPNAKYWMNGANNSLLRLQDKIGIERANQLTENIVGTWREIYNAIEDLNEAAQENEKEAAEISETLAWLGLSAELPDPRTPEQIGRDADYKDLKRQENELAHGG